MANYSLGIKPIPDVENGHIFTTDNFLQLLPHTRICEGKNGLKFVKCNLTNCDLPPDAITEGCRPYHVEWCSNLHPHFVEWGLPNCLVNCPHVVSIDTITIDGVVIETVYHYEDKLVI